MHSLEISFCFMAPPFTDFSTRHPPGPSKPKQDTRPSSQNPIVAPCPLPL
jgi:hypothetical protein